MRISWAAIFVILIFAVIAAIVVSHLNSRYEEDRATRSCNGEICVATAEWEGN